MEEANVQDKTEAKQQKGSTSLYWTNINLKLNAALKLVILITILAIASAGGLAYKDYAHNGPSCDQGSFGYWIKEEGKVLSMHKAKLQTENGTTQCFGTFKTQNGLYKNWSGHLTQLKDGSIIGSARLR